MNAHRFMALFVAALSAVLIGLAFGLTGFQTGVCAFVLSMVFQPLYRAGGFH